MPRYSPLAIANEFLRRSRDTSLPGQMQLQKWIYNANGWNLAVNEEPLSAERPEAWDNGPVFRSVWDHIRDHGFGNNGLLLDSRGQQFHAPLEDEELEVVARTWRKYRDFSGNEMSRMSHQIGSPWYAAYFDEGRNSPLSNAGTRRYFRRLAAAGRV